MRRSLILYMQETSLRSFTNQKITKSVAYSMENVEERGEKSDIIFKTRLFPKGPEKSKKMGNKSLA